MNNLSKINLGDIQAGYTLGHADAAILREELQELLAYREAAGKSAAVIYKNGSGASVLMVGSDLPDGYSDMYLAPQLSAVPDSVDYKALVMVIAEIAHGGRTDINLLPVTIRSLQQRCASIVPPAAAENQ